MLVIYINKLRPWFPAMHASKKGCKCTSHKQLSCIKGLVSHWYIVPSNKGSKLMVKLNSVLVQISIQPIMFQVPDNKGM